MMEVAQLTATTDPRARAHPPGRPGPRRQHPTASASAPRLPPTVAAAVATHPPGALAPKPPATASRPRLLAPPTPGPLRTHPLASTRPLLAPDSALLLPVQRSALPRLVPTARLPPAHSTRPRLAPGLVAGAPMRRLPLAPRRRLLLVLRLGTIARLRLVATVLLRLQLPVDRGTRMTIRREGGVFRCEKTAKLSLI